MLQPDVVARLRLMADTARLPAAAETNRVQQVGEVAQGERVSARVERELPNATFHVAIRGRLYEMRLPAGLRQGDALQLTYVGDRPRPTFFLVGARGAEAGDRLSQTGRLISALISEAPDEEHHLLRNATPVLPEGPGDSDKSVSLLRSALSQSGLFYESHQAQWVAGHRSLDQLRQEPQARVAGAPIQAPQPEAADAARTTAVARPGDDAPQPAELRGGPVHPDTYPIVRQQLEVLDSRHALWQGQVWPGQWMEWETGEAPEEAEHGGQEAWYTTLTLALPALGALRARAILAGDGVRISIDCLDAATGERLRGAAATLAAGLKARGIDLANFTVTANEKQ